MAVDKGVSYIVFCVFARARQYEPNRGHRGIVYAVFLKACAMLWRLPLGFSIKRFPNATIISGLADHVCDVHVVFVGAHRVLTTFYVRALWYHHISIMLYNARFVKQSHYSIHVIPK